MATVCFELAHGTSKECASAIQVTGFRLTETGYWGPAVYFYETSFNGIENAKKWIDKKILNKRIADKKSSIVLLACAQCDDYFFLDGTNEHFQKALREVEKIARGIAWEDAKNALSTHGIPVNKREIDVKVNRHRNAFIEKLETGRRSFKIFKCFLHKEDICIAIRDATCLSQKPYKEVMYE